jgi:hypothetical protein
VRLAEEAAIKSATLLGETRAAVPKVMTSYTDHGKTSSVKRNSGRRPKQSEMGRCTLKRTVSKNHRTAAAKVTATPNIWGMDKIIGTVLKDTHVFIHTELGHHLPVI